MMPSAPLVLLFALATAIACVTDADCLNKGMSMPKCVNQTGGGWSQCVDCEANAFENACPYWGPKVREPAEEICALKCTGKPPQNLTCTSDKDCTDPTHPTCVVQSDGNYAQCITCDSTQFQRDCPEWNRDKFLPRAESKCGIECTGAGGLACHTDDDCTDVGAPTCVVQKDGYYAQCVTCESTQFQKDCVDWDVAQFLPAAEARCHETCNRMWWDSSFSTVDK